MVFYMCYRFMDEFGLEWIRLRWETSICARMDMVEAGTEIGDERGGDERSGSVGHGQGGKRVCTRNDTVGAGTSKANLARMDMVARSNGDSRGGDERSSLDGHG